jgi:hypothetical protein
LHDQQVAAYGQEKPVSLKALNRRNWRIIMSRTQTRFLTYAVLVLLVLTTASSVEARKKRKKEPVGNPYAHMDWKASEAINTAIARSIQNGVRDTLLEVMKYRASLGSTERQRFDMVAAKNGMDYLGNIYFASREIVLTHEEDLGSTRMGILGTSTKYAHYASIAERGEILYLSGSLVVGFMSHSDITRAPSISPHGAVSRYKGEEIYGEYWAYLDQKNLSKYDILTTALPTNLPGKYAPLTFVKESSDVSGGLIGGISDFIEEHPLFSAAIATGLLVAISDDDGSSSGSSSSAPSNSFHDNTDLYVAWRDAEKEQRRTKQAFNDCVNSCKARSGYAAQYSSYCHDRVCGSQKATYDRAKTYHDEAKRRYLNSQ